MQLKKLTYIITFITVLFSVISHAQHSIEGIVIDENSKPIVGATIKIVELKNKGTVSDFNGEFTLSLSIKNEYSLQVSFVGYKTRIEKLNTFNGELVTIILQNDIEALDSVVLQGKSKAQQLREKAFEVAVIQTDGLKNISIDVNSVLSSIPGVNVRESGGMGAFFDFSLNGLSGKQIKFFLNGIPLENLGNSLTLNNFPATLIDRIEVYKGVVPIHLGADALGGAVNILTSQKNKKFIDVSYDLGAFNTHRATINGQFTTDYGLLLRVSSFYNHSDNDYTIDGIEVRDDLGNDTGKTVDNVKRFNDAYNSQMITLKTGVINKSFANKLLFGITASANKNNIQHAYDFQTPFGEVFTSNNVLSGHIDFEKDSLFRSKLKLKAYASLAKNTEKLVDSSSRKYDWYGNYKVKANIYTGELGRPKTLFQYKDQLHLINTLLTYTINSNNTILFNYTKNYIKRIGEDPLDKNKIPFENPHTIKKNIFGMSYDFKVFTKKWKTSIFSKLYLLNSDVTNEDLFAENDENRFKTINNAFNKQGYGVATTYKFSNNSQIKVSFERAYRMPESYELFGDALFVLSNSKLVPEESYNANLGFLLNIQIEQAKIQFDTNVFLRESKNFISIRSEGIFSKYYNTASARSAGIEGELKTLIKNKLFVDVNVTYQNIIDLNTGENSNVTYLKNQRIPNIPYLFGNFRIGYKTDNILSKSDNFNVSLSSFYSHQYPLESYVEGAEEYRLYVPKQLSHDLQLGYSINKKYNISLLAKNITDENIYDNFEMQQPGRAFYIKLRYYLTNILK